LCTSNDIKARETEAGAEVEDEGERVFSTKRELTVFIIN